MKNIFNFIISVAALLSANSINAQTNYTVNLGTSFSPACTAACSIDAAANIGRSEDFISKTSTYTTAVSASLVADSLSNLSGAWNGDAVTLTWNTQQEINSSKFIIEKSSTGSNWQTLGTAAAAGNSSSAIVYYYSDAEPSTVIYYRLKQVDSDGAYVYSKVVRMAKGENAFGITLYPNTITNKATIRTTSANNKTVSIKIYSSDGVMVKELTKQLTAGVNNVDVPSVNTLTKGMYTVVMSDSKDIVFASFTKK